MQNVFLLEGPILKGLRSHLYNSHFRFKGTESDVYGLEMTTFLKMTKSLREHLMIKTMANHYHLCFFFLR